MMRNSGRNRQAGTADGWRIPAAIAGLLALAAGLVAASTPSVCRAGPLAQRQDQEEARRQREAGRILDYGRIRSRALQAVPGRIVDQELRRRGSGRYVYRLKILRSDGKVSIVLIDAHTGRILEVRRR